MPARQGGAALLLSGCCPCSLQRIVNSGSASITSDGKMDCLSISLPERVAYWARWRSRSMYTRRTSVVVLLLPMHTDTGIIFSPGARSTALPKLLKHYLT